MTSKQVLLAEIEGIPEPLLAEVVDFVRFLKKQRLHDDLEAALLSEPSLAKDWERPEEEEAW